MSALAQPRLTKGGQPYLALSPKKNTFALLHAAPPHLHLCTAVFPVSPMSQCRGIDGDRTGISEDLGTGMQGRTRREHVIDDHVTSG